MSSNPPLSIEETLEGQVGPLLVQLSTWLNHIGIPHTATDESISMSKQSHGLEFEVIWEELPGILAGFVSLLSPLGDGESEDDAVEYLEQVEPIPPRFLEVASYIVDAINTPGLYLRLRMPLRFAPETAADAIELISWMVDRHAAVLTGAAE